MIQYFRSGKLPAALTLLLLTLLVLDLFLLDKKLVAEIVDNGTIEISYSKSNGGEDQYYLITKSRRYIPVSEALYNEILIGDTIYISNTPLFGKMARMNWCRNNACYSKNINPLNTNYFTDILIAALLATALMRLLRIQKLDVALDWMVLLVAAGMLGFYLYK